MHECTDIGNYVKNSCWTFSATETLESHIAIQTGFLFTLSEQGEDLYALVNFIFDTSYIFSQSSFRASLTLRAVGAPAAAKEVSSIPPSLIFIKSVG